MIVAAVIAIIAVCTCFGVCVTHFISKKYRLHRAARPFIAAGTGILPLVAICAVYLNIFYRADSEAVTAMEGGDGVTVSCTDFGWFFDGKGCDSAVIFYPGAKVEPQAYAPLLKDLAGRGVDCFLVDMPGNIALLGVDKADEIISKYSYESWYIAGHSLGGTAAASYCAEVPEKADGLILLASYSTAKLDDDLPVLSVYGSDDGVLNMDNYFADKANLPVGNGELVINGGNLGQFGCYGEQRGDRKASISAKEQRNVTAEAIIGLINGVEIDD